MAEVERRPCPDCGKEVTWTQAGAPRKHKCIEKQESQPAQEQPTNQPAAQPGKVTPEVVIAAYINTRDEISQLKKKHEDEVAALKELQAKREKYLGGAMNKVGAESLKTGAGTVFFDWKDSATVDDGEAFKGWVQGDWEKRKHFLPNSVSKAAVKGLHEEGKTAPPGVSYKRFKSVKIRRA